MKKHDETLTHDEVLREVRAMIEASNQRQVALNHGLTPAQLNQYLRGVISLSPAMAEKLGFEPRTVYVRKRKGKKRS